MRQRTEVRPGIKFKEARMFPSSDFSDNINYLRVKCCTKPGKWTFARYHFNQLCPFSSALKFVNRPFSLCLQASKGCQSKEQILQERFQKASKSFQQWLVNAKITTAKCFDLPQNLSEVSSSLQKIQVRPLLSMLKSNAEANWYETLGLCKSALQVKV